MLPVKWPGEIAGGTRPLLCSLCRERDWGNRVLMFELAIVIGLCALDAVLGLYALHRLALWLESRGHLFYLHRRPESSGGSVFAPLQEIIQPSVKHVHHVKDEKRKEQQDPGAPPEDVE